jgi:hypothetical protein
LSNIVLTAYAVSEDVDLRIRATKTFDPSEDRPTDTDLLDAVLPLKVEARRDLSITAEPSIVDYSGNAVVRIDNTQVSARYIVYVRAVSDGDFVFGATSGAGCLAVNVENVPVHVRRAPVCDIWEDLEGFQAVGELTPGNGGTLRLPVTGLTPDSQILVRAQKDHQGRTAVLPSAVQLLQAALCLTRPNPRPELKLGVVISGAQTTGTLEVTGGQPGVFYEVRSNPAGAPLGLPAYFHKTDESNPALNKGIEQLRIEVDLAISRGTVRPATTATELASTRPLTPVLSTGLIAAGTTLYLRAVKAQTRVAVDLVQTAQIAPVPQIDATQTTVPKGSAATIVVHASAVGDRYQLTLGGQPVGPARDGNWANLTFPTDPLQAATQFEMEVTRPGDTGIPVERRVQIIVGVA